MTVRISIPLGGIRTLAVLALAWGGAAGIAFGVSYWLDDEGIQRGELGGYVTREQLTDYAANSDLASIREQVSRLEDRTMSPFLQAALEMVILDATARGRLAGDAVRVILFAGASTSDFDACIDFLSGRATEVSGRQACDRVHFSPDLWQ